jgi:Tol biopolymer transport system component
VGSVPVGTWTIAGTGDFNGDGISDILFRSSDGGVALWLMNSNGTLMSALGVGSVAIAWSIAQTGDFNGDGKSDILWHDNDGSVALWLMDSATVTPLGIGAVDPAWQIQGMNAD